MSELAKTKSEKRHSMKRKLQFGSAVAASAVATVAAHPAKTAAANKPPKPNLAAQLRKEKQAEARQQKTIDRLAGEVALSVKFPGIKVTKETVEGKGLKSLDSLPGAKMKITPEQQHQQEKSTVHLVYREKGSDNSWSGWCSGTKITYKGQVYIISAAHCYKSGLGINFDDTGGEPSYDYINANVYEFGIVKRESEEPYVLVTGISMDVNDDWALLKTDIAPTPNGQQLFDQIPPVDFNKPSRQPIPGEEGIIHGYAQFNGFQATTEKVRYLGRYQMAGLNYTNHYYDLVAIKPDVVKKNGCLPGFSGSGIKFADGSESGPLTGVWDFGYTNSSQNALSPFPVNSLNRYAFEQLTHVDLSEAEAVCLLSVRDIDNLGQKVNTMDNLVDGFSRPVPILGSSANPGKGKG